MKYFLELPRSRKLCWRTCFHIAPQLRALAQPSHVWQPGASWQRRLPRLRHGVGGTPLHPPHLHPPGERQRAHSSPLLPSARQVPDISALSCRPAIPPELFFVSFFFFFLLCLKLYIVPKFPCFMSLFVAVFESWHIFVQLKIYLHYLLNKDYSC